MSAESERFSTVVELIYRSITSPGLWVDVLEQLCVETRCCAATILSTDLTTRGIQHFFSWNFSPEVLARVFEYGDESAKVWQTLPGFWFRDLDEPGTSLREAPHTYGESRWVAEVMAPMGIIDSLHLILLRSSERVADVALFRHVSEGPIGDLEIAVLRGYAPHLRRAQEIGHVLEMKALQVAMLSSALDALSPAIVVLDAGGGVREANATARQLLVGGRGAVLHGDRLLPADPAARLALRQALTQAVAGIGGVVELSGGGGAATMLAYLSPLRVNTDGRVEALALMVVPVDRSVQRQDFAAVGRIFGLSRAETRVLRKLLGGSTLAEIARALGVAESTVKSQRMSIYAKTGVSRRAQLTELMSRFMAL
jgi:DNA-binding CsgD family transcriptional regulator